MFGSEILEIAIGLIFVYLLLSLMASTINEVIANLFSLRGRNLKKAINFMFDEKDTQFQIQKFFDDPLIKKLSARPFLDKTRMASPTDYLANGTFSKILTRAIFKSNELNIPVETLEKNIDDMFPAKGDTNRILKRFVRESAGDLNKLKEHLEDWYDEIMNVATEWYKSKVRIILFVIGFISCVVFNADTIAIWKNLSEDPVARQALVNQAEQFNEVYINQFAENDTTANFDTLKVKLKKLNTELTGSASILKLGWDFDEKLTFWGKAGFVLGAFPNKILGWLITSIAISLGASFWFKLLQNVLNIKSSVKK